MGNAITYALRAGKLAKQIASEVSDAISPAAAKQAAPETKTAKALRDYKGSHSAPGPDYGTQLHDLSGNGMYPEDVYSKNGPRYYGSGFDEMDKQAFALAHRVRNNPDALVDIYRAVPNKKEISSINPGDWVAITKAYADQHGISNLPEGYKILQQQVPARNIWTNADSIQEFGYWPD